MSATIIGESLPLSLGRAVGRSFLHRAPTISCVMPEQWAKGNGLCVIVDDDFAAHNRKQVAMLTALQEELADQVKVTPRRTHRPRTPMKKNPTVCQLGARLVDQRYTWPRNGHQQWELRGPNLGVLGKC